MRTPALTLLLFACTTPAPSTDPIGTDTQLTDTDGEVVGPVDTVTDPVDSDTEPPEDTEPPVPTRIIDCAALPQPPLTTRQVPRAKAYHGIAFDFTGGIHGNNNGLMIRADYAGVGGPWATGLGVLEQIDIMPNGDLIAASPSRGGILRIATNASVTTIASVNNVYGLRLGPDGMIYTANQNQMHRIDPTTGEVEVFLPSAQGFVPKAFDWSVEHDKMYIGTNGTEAKVWVVDLDANYDPVGSPRLFARNVGVSWHDAVSVDICGNLYVAEYNSRSLYRVTPDGQVSLLVEAGGFGAQYGHGVTFGSGIGGWPDDALYQPLPYAGNNVLEVSVGVPYRTFTAGTVINRP
jgi:hypothetical protein